MEEIDPHEAARLIEDGARLVDVREQHEYDELHIAGAKLMPLSQYEPDPTLLPPARVTIFQCAHGNRSRLAAELYEGTWPGSPAYNLAGGIVAWQDAGLPVERS